MLHRRSNKRVHFRLSRDTFSLQSSAKNGTVKKHLLSSPEKKQWINRRLKTISRAKQRLSFTIKKLKEELKQFEEKLETLTEEKVEDHITRLKICSAQAMVLREIIKIAKYKSKHGRRYSSDWLLTCMLMRIRSPGMYEFILRNEILPLPSSRTIKRHLSAVKIDVGFDAAFLEAFKKKMARKRDREKYGILVFDEVSVRKGLKTDAKTMKYQGVVDFGDSESGSTEPGDLADHALVFGFSSLIENYFQPIGCFSSKGNAPGVTLAKLTLQAILLLEKAGVKVAGIVCDGAKTNRRMWKEFGVDGKLGSLKHYFENPAGEDRKIFVMSDAPHLFKCIRNRLLKKPGELMVRDIA